MNNFTTNTYELKREIVNFSKKISDGLNKSQAKFAGNIQYGITSLGSCVTSEISRNLHGNIKLKNTIERLCDNLNNFNKNEVLYNNYIKSIGNICGDEPMALFDDSDIVKRYEKKIEDLDRVIDASSMDRKTLSIKIIEMSKSLRNKVIIWISQFAKWIRKILSYAHTGIKQWQNIEIREKYKQLLLKL